MKTVDITFFDLNEETQQAVLDLYEISSPSEANLDTIPLVSLTVYEAEE